MKHTKEEYVVYRNAARMWVQGERCRLGNPKHPYYDMYKQHGIDAVIEELQLAETTPMSPTEDELDFPWSSVVFGIVIVVIILAHTVGS